MTDMTTFNAKRQARTEARIAEIESILSKRPLYREHLLAKIGLSEQTASVAIRAALKQKRIRYERGLYLVVER